VQSAELVVVRVVPTRIWHALLDDEVAGKAHAVRRPDGRYFVAIDAWRDEVFDVLLDAVVDDLPYELSTLAGEADEDAARWRRRGFGERRREDEYEIPLDGTGPPRATVPEGYRLVPAATLDVDVLRELDDELRQDVPGMRGWRNEPETFADQTLRSPLFRPATSLVAVEAAGTHAGLVHVRSARRWAKLALLGVRPAHRRRGLGRALLATALGALHDDGVGIVLAEADAANQPARALLAGFGARRTGGTVELVREAAAMRR
jgi:ribosomal protein S18 acetylase RimI-like enzyme